MRLWLLVTSTVTFLSAVVATTNRNVNIVYRYERTDDKHAIAAFDGAKRLIGYTCDYTLDHGSFATEHIQFEVDEQADGNIRIGGKTYPIHSKAEHSGGPTCTQVYNHKMVELDCVVTMDAKFKPSLVAANSTKQCFGHDLASFDLRKGIRRIDTSRAGTVNLSQKTPPRSNGLDGFLEVDKRCLSEKTTDAVTGVPQQQYYDKQFTKNIRCEASSTCSASVTDSISYAFTFTATVTPVKWISAGFSVGKTWTEASTYTCGGKEGQTVCVWYSAAHTKYRAQNMIYNYCENVAGSTELGDKYDVTSPNTDAKGSDFYCVVGTCRDQGERYWNTDGRVGGPGGTDDLGDKGVNPCSGFGSVSGLLGIDVEGVCDGTA